MGRVLPAFILALLIHGMLLFWVDGEWADRTIAPPRTHIITMTMFQREVPKPAVPLKKKVPGLKKVLPKPKVEKAVLPPSEKKEEIPHKPEPEPVRMRAEKPPEPSPSQPTADSQKKDEPVQIESETEKGAASLLAKGDDRANVEAVTEAVPLYQINPPPSYPVIARRRGYTGTVTLEVLVNTEGRVSDVRVSGSSGHSSLDRSALRSVKKWIFEPGKKGMKKVEMWVRVPVRFQLEAKAGH